MYRFAWLPLFVLSLVVSSSQYSVGQAPEKSDARPLVTSVPRIDSEIHSLMQSRAYEDAIKAIDLQLAKAKTPHRDYLTYLKGVAYESSKQLNQAVETYQSLEGDFPKSDWVSRARFGRASVAATKRQYNEAGEIYRAEATRLLSRGRKDDLAKIYLEFANRYFQGIPAADPSQARKPDYKQALEYYREALKLGPTTENRQQIEFRIARSLHELKQHNEAIAAYQKFLDDHGSDSDAADQPASAETESEIRFRLGLAQLESKQFAKARRTWQALLKENPSAADEKIAEFLARAQYRLAHTYGLPGPRTVGDLELAVTLAEKFLADHPDHDLAAKAELEIAQGYEHHGRFVQAVEQLEKLIANEAYKDSEHLPVARRMLGQSYLAQKEFDKAIAAWKTFLEKHPTDPRWPEVQKQIISAEFAAASDAFDQKDFAEARELWQTFLNKYPLDGRAAQVLFSFGAMNYDEAERIHEKRVKSAVESGKSADEVKVNKKCRELYEAAIVDWKRVANKYPGSTQASYAMYRIGQTQETRLDERKLALESYKKVKGSYEAKAKQQIAYLTKPQLVVATERKYRSDETPKIKLTTRNLEKVSVKVYRIDMADYFRKMHLASGVEKLDIALIDPDEQFVHTIKDYEDYKQIQRDVELPIESAGVCAVTVSSEKLEATTMMVVSDLDIVVKSSRNELFLFAENMLTGKPAGEVNVLVSDGNEVFEELTTDDEGIARSANEKLKTVNDLRVFAIESGHVASTVNQLNGLAFAVGLAPTGHLFSDRPVYRPGELVNIKGVVRWVDGDRFTFEPGSKFTLDVYDTRGRKLKTEEVALNPYGTIQSNLMLPEATPPGDCRIHLHRKKTLDQSALSFESKFRVQTYKLEPIELQIETDKNVYFRGDEIVADITLQYYYGAPLPGETINYSFGGDGEKLTAITDDDGKLELKLSTDRFSETQNIPLIVECPQRNVTEAKTLFLATRGFGVTVSTARSVFINGETFDADIKVTDPAGEPVETELKLQVFERPKAAGRRFGASGERLVDSYLVKTDPETGRASKTITAGLGGNYIIRATGVDQFENQVSGQTYVAVSGNDDTTRLRILADQHQFRVGDDAEIRIHWREEPALALITFDGASVLGHRLVELKKGTNKVNVPMESQLAPNFFFSVCVMQKNRLHQASSPFVVSKQLGVELTPSDQELQPGDKLTLDIVVKDSAGNPTSAEIAIAMVQANLLDRFGNMQASIVDRFRSRPRTSRVRQTSSCTFSYSTKTQSIDSALLAETERLSRRRLEREARNALATRAAADPFGGEGNADGVSDASLNAGNNSAIMVDELFGAAPPTPGSGGPGPGQMAGNMPSPANLSLVESQSETIGFDGQMGLPQAGQQLELQRGMYPVQGYRTEVRKRTNEQGVVQSYTVQVPYTEQAQQAYIIGGLNPSSSQVTGFTQRYVEQGNSGQWSRGRINANYAGKVSREDFLFDALPSTGNFDASILSSRSLQQRQVTLNGLTAKGQLIVLNGRDRDEVLVLAREDGVQVIPLATSGETGFWDPMVVTDENGKAQIEITMPTDSTAWRIQAAAVNHDGLTGEATANLITRKTLFGQMRLPTALTIGDKSVIQTEVHCGLAGEREIQVVLKTTMGDVSKEQQKTIKIDGEGITPVDFPITVSTADEAQFELKLSSVADDKNITDTLEQNVLIQPFGMPVYQTASGTASQSTLALIELESFPDATGHSLELLIGGDINRTLLETMQGGRALLPNRCIVTDPLQRSASDCLGGVAMLEMVRRSIGGDSPQASQLSDAIAGAVSNLVASQLDSGGWDNGSPLISARGAAQPLQSARIMWGLATARDAGFAVPNDVFDKGKSYLRTAFTQTKNLNNQAILLHSMSRCGSGDFALANRLYRERNRLTPHGVTHLMLALNALNHKEMSRELISLVDSKKFSAEVTRAGTTGVELGSLYLIALQELNLEPDTRTTLSAWLLSKRVGDRWTLESESGPAIAALARHHATAQPRGETFKLEIVINGKPLETIEIRPNDASRRIEVPSDFLRDSGRQEIDFQIEGRGEFTYSAVMTAFADASKVKGTTQDFRVSRKYEPDVRRLDGKEIPRGFGVVRRSNGWKPNVVKELTLGTRGQVTLSPRVNYYDSKPHREYMVLIEPIPSGCTILEKSISGTFDRYEITPGTITFYLGDHRTPSDIRYTLLGYLPGDYRVAPSVLRSYYDPAKIAVSNTKTLKVLPVGQPTSDIYRLTPDELYHFGKAYFAKKEFGKAHEHFTKLLDGWELHPDPYKETVTHLFNTSMELGSHAETVRYFEVMKERFPDVELSFESILKVAAAYREIGEYERSYLVYRATVQGSFERENQVAGFLNARGEFLRSVQTMESLLRDYPAESYVATASYALAQEVYRRAESLKDDKKMADAGVTRADLISGSIQMLDHFVTRWPEDPSSDQAGFALTTGLIDLDQYEHAIERAERYAKTFPESGLLDSFWYMIGYCNFELQNHKLALEMCRKVAEAEITDSRSGSKREAQNKWEAIYIMGQVYHSLGQAAEAIDEYTKVSERFSDAAEAIEYFSHKDIELPAVTTIAPNEKQEVELQFRNLPSTLVKVYRIDLMKFGLTQRNLDRITAINLAGIKPYHQEEIELGDGKDYRDRERTISLPLKEEGAYLVVCRSENLYTSGLVVVSPLEVVVQEDVTSGRVRVSVKDRESDAFVSNVHVKVIGTGNEDFSSGETDLRGLYVADNIQGKSTVIAVSKDHEYAFYRGETSLQNYRTQTTSGGNGPFGAPAPQQPAAQIQSGKGQLRGNIMMQNRAYQQLQQDNFEELIENGREGVKSKEAF